MYEQIFQHTISAPYFYFFLLIEGGKQDYGTKDLSMRSLLEKYLRIQF